jgi:macrolide-specific efflux system membrane fusion protein
MVMKRKRYLMIAALCAAAALAGIYLVKRNGGGTESAEVLRPVYGSVRSAITTTGTVQPQNRLELKPPIGGRIEEILVEEGDKVKTGQTLAWMSSTERAALLDAARPHGEKAIEYWKEVYKPTPLIAPIDGEVIVRAFEPGQTVTSSDAVLVLSDRLIVQAQVDETDIGKVKPGEESVVSLDAYPQIKVKGKVDQISYESKIVNNVTIYEVDIVPEKVPDIFRSGMSAVVEIVEGRKEHALLLPLEAVTRAARGSSVFVREGGETVTRKVTLGLSDNANVEIISGLTEKDQVVLKQQKKAPRKTASSGTSPLMPPRPGRR